jgi:hypothetical protein
MEFGLNVLASIVGSVILTIITLLIFDVEKFKYKFFKILPFKVYHSFERINSRTQVLTYFKELFINYNVNRGGRILLMSNTGGYPEYDPYNRILELTSYNSVETYIAVTRVSFKEYYSKFPQIGNQLVSNPKIKFYVFDNLTPYRFRIGINTDVGMGFFCGYYGHNENKVSLEGIKSTHPVIMEAIETLYLGLLGKGTHVTSQNLNSIVS